MSNYIRFLPNPITDYLIHNWQLIRDELIQYRLEKTKMNLLEVQHSSNKLNFKETVHLKQPLFQGNILAVALYVHRNILTSSEATQMKWSAEEKERWWHDNIDSMPTISKWLKEHQTHLDGVIFYAAQPGSYINHHYGVDDTRNNFRMHLCLAGDLECKFNIENEIHAWDPGDLFAFDDAMCFHGIKHRGSVPRIILSVDIKKSALQDFAINFTERPFVSSKEKIPPTIFEW